ncbi:unnamed protein product [Linum tenue]|uniref:Light-harvesting complex-like protein OHP2, chloroplastic n=1 Tax=Linum tenue TaxID=586396 RepID=A0AAV0IH72_9ROSI|nr:unnamed protein product [Linum tenue]
MSVSSPFPSPCSAASPSTSAAASSSTSVRLRISATTAAAAARPYSYYHGVSIRSSQAEGPIRRPVAPSLREPSPPSSASTPLKPVPPSPPSSSPPPPPPGVAEGKGAVTLEFQRQKAKELQEYFKQKKLEEANQGPFFGFIGKNEISNGRWAMFGFAVGMLTEYATGSDFVDQVKILLSNFGILDLD